MQDGGFTYKEYKLSEIKVKRPNKLEEVKDGADEKALKDLLDWRKRNAFRKGDLLIHKRKIKFNLSKAYTN